MLEGIDNTKVFTYFEEISAVPRGSGYNEKISNYLCEFAKQHDLEYKVDESFNVLIKKPGTGMGVDKEPVIIQGHMDMVCVQDEGIHHDFKEEGLELILDGDNLYANGTTLGGDDGIALAYSLALLDTEGLDCPPLEVLFTTDEEVGMFGAAALDASWLSGKIMLNIDNETEGEILVSCAGGMSVHPYFEAKKEETDGYVYELTVKGLRGGHSGVEIYKNQTNASIVAARVMWNVKVPFQLVSIEGGTADNVIPKQAKFVFVTKEEIDIKDVIKSIEAELKSRESELTITLSLQGKKNVMAFSEERSGQVTDYMNLAITGVQTMSGSIEGMVESSLNLGVAYSDETGFHLGFATRSQKSTYKEYMGTKLEKLARMFGAEVSREGIYPAWDYKEDSKVRDIAIAEFEKVYGYKAEVKGIHAGLECGILSEKVPELDIISFGPTIRDIHTSKETMSVKSAQKGYELVKAILKKLAI